jgi:hypothetical protein
MIYAVSYRLSLVQSGLYNNIGKNKKMRHDYLIQPRVNVRYPAVIRGRDVPLLWQSFLHSFFHTRDDNYLQQIIKHNESDLLRELYLLVYYRDRYKV